jgi:hypothetical protein
MYTEMFGERTDGSGEVNTKIKRYEYLNEGIDESKCSKESENELGKIGDVNIKNDNMKRDRKQSFEAQGKEKIIMDNEKENEKKKDIVSRSVLAEGRL